MQEIRGTKENKVEEILNAILKQAESENAFCVLIYWVRFDTNPESRKNYPWYRDIVAVSFSDYRDSNFSQLSKTDYGYYWDDEKLVEEHHGHARHLRTARLEQEFGSRLNYKVYRHETKGWNKQK